MAVPRPPVRSMPELFAAIRAQDSLKVLDILKDPAIRAQLNNLNSEGYTPLAYACMYDKTPQAAIVSILLGRLANPNIPCPGVYPGYTALMLALLWGNDNVVKKLIKASNLDLTAVESTGCTSLMVAILSGKENVVKELLKASTLDLNAVDRDGYTPLMFAVNNGKEIAVRELLTASNLDLNAVDNNGHTALMIAAMIGNENIVKELLKASNLDLNAVDNNGRTALMLVNGNENVVKELLKASSLDLSIVNKAGNNALDVAKVRYMPEVARLIKEKLDRKILAESVFAANVKLIKEVGHKMGLGTAIKGTDTVSVSYPSTGEVKIKVEGSFSHLSMPLISEGIKAYVNDPNIDIKKSAEKKIRQAKILEAYEVSADFVQFTGKETLASLCKRYAEGKIVILPIGVNRSHEIGIIFYKNKMIYCNRGEGGRKEIKIYEMTDEERTKIMTVEFLQKLYPKGTNITDDELIALLASKVESFGKVPPEPLYEFWQKDQRYGNCTYVNPNTTYELIEFLLKIEELTGETMEVKIKRCQEEANEEYHQRTAYMRNRCAESLIKGLTESRARARAGDPNSKQRHEIYLKLIVFSIKEHHGKDSRNRRRAAKVIGEISRAHDMLSALTADEKKTVFNDLGSSIVDIWLIAARNKSDKAKGLCDILLPGFSSQIPEVKKVLVQMAHEDNAEQVLKLIKLLGKKVAWEVLNQDDKRGSEILNYAIDNRNVAMLSAILEGLEPKHREAALNQKDVNGTTPLYRVLENRNPEIRVAILEKLDPGPTALMLAAALGNQAKVSEILKKLGDGSKVALALKSGGYYDSTSLMLATSSGSVATVSAILKHLGEKEALEAVNQEDGNHSTILTSAIMAGDVGMVSGILDELATGAREAVLNHKGSYFGTPLELALRRNNPLMISAILKKLEIGVTYLVLTAASGNNEKVSEILKKLGDRAKETLNREGADGRTPLMLIAMFGNAATISEVFNTLGDGAKEALNHKDPNGRTALMLAVRDENLSTVSAILKHLGEKEACEALGQNDPSSLYASSILQQIVYTDKMPILLSILEGLGTSSAIEKVLNYKDKYSSSTLTWVIEKQNAKMISAMLEKLEPGSTALMLAAASGNNEKVSVILKKLGDGALEALNQKDTKDNTPLMLAARYGNAATVSEILNKLGIKAKEALNQKARYGDSVLINMAHKPMLLLTALKHLGDKTASEVLSQEDVGVTIMFILTGYPRDAAIASEILKMLGPNASEVMNRKGSGGNTPLMQAALSGNNEMLSEMLKTLGSKAKEALNETNYYGETALMQARTDDTKSLLEKAIAEAKTAAPSVPAVKVPAAKVPAAKIPAAKVPVVPAKAIVLSKNPAVTKMPAPSVLSNEETTIVAEANRYREAANRTGSAFEHFKSKIGLLPGQSVKKILGEDIHYTSLDGKSVWGKIKKMYVENQKNLAEKSTKPPR